uniref:Uncharacterized protein n=1 Tax=Lactuca sativa TaxID=4236 RepID=A0A9R1XXY5_LACSA|nr:hypothetical protein LSAT_V11C100035450 [Lactuca sativa]
MQRLVPRQDLNVKSYYKKLLNLLKKIKLASNSKALKTTFGATQCFDSSSNLLPCPEAFQSSNIRLFFLERKLSNEIVKENLVMGFF